MLVDPAYAVEPFLDAAASRGLVITRVLETHTHADHVSGHGRLALEQGLPVSVHTAADAAYPHEHAEGRGRDRRRLARRQDAAHARAPAGALLLPRRRRTAHRRLPVRGRHRAAGPRRRRTGRRGRALPQPAPPAGATRRREGDARTCGRLTVRCGHERRALVHDRLRAALQPGAGPRHCRGVRGRLGGRHHATAAEHGTHRRAQPWAVRGSDFGARADRSRRPLRARRSRR